MSSLCRCASVVVVFAAACLAQANPQGIGAGPAEFARINEMVRQYNALGQYCESIGRLQQSSEPIRLFSSQGQWHQGTPSKSDVADSVASVWLRRDRVVAATISSEATAQTGIQGTSYCFRENGTLARVAALPSLRSSGKAGLRAVVTVGRSETYLENGQSFRPFPDPSFDPHMLKSERTTFRYVEPPVVYKSVEELPFVNLITIQLQASERRVVQRL